MGFNRNMIRTIKHSISQGSIDFLTAHWKDFVATIPAYPNTRFSGRGIVYTAGGVSYVTCLWVSINILRDAGCNLPIEVWHLGNEISTDVMRTFQNLDIQFRDVLEIEVIDKPALFLKPLAILNSRFEEVLFLDADNVCLSDSSYLFDIGGYLKTGTVFWPDYWLTERTNPIWKITEADTYDMPEQESGQLLINKAVCWQELNLCLYFNRLGKYYYKLLYGDKDTFKFAGLALKTEYFMISTPPKSCGTIVNGSFFGNTMVQHDHEGAIAFLHRNLLKWDVTLRYERSWRKIKFFKEEPAVREIHLKQKRKMVMVDLDGDTECEDVPVEVSCLEEKCLAHLRRWRSTDTYYKFFEHMHLVNQRYQFIHRFSLT